MRGRQKPKLLLDFIPVLDHDLAIVIYQMSKSFGTRPYLYICPELKDPKNQLNIDAAIYMYGIRDEEKRAKETQKKSGKKVNNEPRNRISY